ncbi:uncharacterized protein LOC132311946 isoform X2 [Cornus florida]|nr:uncharacterized protein LOC132311946 isoform X2 [Cornus florida]
MERIPDDESCRPSGSRGDGKYSRNSREPPSFSQKDWRGHSRETGASPNGPGRPHDLSDQRSVNDMLTYNSHPHSDFINTWDQIKDQNDKIDGVNGLGTGQRSDRENSLGSIDWKPLKWTRSGSLSSRGSGFSHSSSSKSIGVDVSESKTEVQPRNVTPLQSPSGDAVACVTSAPPSEETNSRKKPRLGWGEGLAKYEKKKVGGVYDSATKNGTAVLGGTESIHSHISNLADKSPGITGFSDCASPATPSSVGCSSSPGIEEKPFVKVASNDNDTSNLIDSPSLVSWSHLDGLAFNLENVELTPIINLSTSLSELLQSDDVNLVDSSFVRSTAMNKLLVLKGDISKVLETTESEIDLLENELKSLISDSGNNRPCPASSSSLPIEGQAKPCEQLVAASMSIPRPAPLQLVSSGDMIVEKAVGVLEEENAEVKDEDVDSPGTATSKFIEPTSSVKAASISNMGKRGECSGVLEQSRFKSLEMKYLVYGSNEQKKEGASASVDGSRLIPSKSCVPLYTDESLNCYREASRLSDLILASNKDSSNRASNVFNKLLPSNQCIDIPTATSISCCQNDSLVKEKFVTRKRFLKFKERVITLKFRAFQHLWKEDMRLLSTRKYRAKPQKKFEARTAHSGHQKNRSSFRSRFSSPAGNLSLVPTTEIVNFTNKLLSDSQVKLFRNSLKMPALILDKKEKISRFISNNGLVEDPSAVEKERARINPWTPEEKEVFMDKLSTFGKEFKKIASFLDHKTTADCVEFYYKNHKSDCFEKTKKKPDFEKKGKSYPTNGYLVTSGKRWNREMNAASLDMLGEASAVAANADDGMENQLKGTARWAFGDYKTPRGDNGILDRSSSLSIFGNERETVAADVLAGICGSLSSEAMSSCITSSFDPGEGYQEWKCQKVGSLMRRPLTAEVTQNIDDETCSDDSCGEMDSTAWTDQEKSIFVQAVSSYGKDFTRISRCVRTRSRDQCKIFFSKARKCLGLDMVRPRPGNEGMPVSEDTNGGGSDAEDACVVETGTVICGDKSGFKLDEDMKPDLNMNHESDPVATLNFQTDMKILEDYVRGELDCKGPVNAVVDDCQLEGKLQLDFDGDSNVETGADGKHVSVQAHGITISSSDKDAGQEGNRLNPSVSVEEGNDHCLSICAEIKSEALVEVVSAVPLGTETEGKQVMPMQGDNSDANARGVNALDCTFQDSGTSENTSSHLAANINSSSGFAVSPKHKPEIALELDSIHSAHVISLQPDSCLVTLNSTPQDSAVSRYEITLNHQDPLTTVDPQKIKDEQCQISTSANDYSHPQHLSEDSFSEPVESSQIVRDYPLQVSVKKEMNGDISSKKPASFQSLPKNFHSDQYLSQDYYLRKCNNSKAHSLVAELPSQEQKRDQSRPISQSLSDVEKPCRNGDVKLFGQILTHPSSQLKPNPSTHENEDKGNQHPKLSSKSSNPKFSGTHSLDANFVPTRFDRNNYLGLENLPMRSYGFWDGNRIQTGFSSLPDSAILLAKYPAAFGNYPTTSAKMEQPLHSVVKSTECNVNGVSVFPRREIGSNGVTDYQTYRNRDGTKGQPFTVDMKQRQDLLFSEMQRRNGFDAVSSIQQQARGMVGINVVGRGGILVGGACTGVSDPVAAIKMHYAKAEQYSGQAGGIISEEDSWRGKGDIGR